MKKSSEKNFGLFFFVFFLLIGLWPLLSHESTRIWSLLISSIFLVTAFFKPKLLKPLNYFWIKLGEMLGNIISPIIMLLVFFLIVTPLSFVIKALGKDLLKLKFLKSDSYWIKREKSINTMDKQF